MLWKSQKTTNWCDLFRSWVKVYLPFKDLPFDSFSSGISMTWELEVSPLQSILSFLSSVHSVVWLDSSSSLSILEILELFFKSMLLSEAFCFSLSSMEDSPVFPSSVCSALVCWLSSVSLLMWLSFACESFLRFTLLSTCHFDLLRIFLFSWALRNLTRGKDKEYVTIF